MIKLFSENHTLQAIANIGSIIGLIAIVWALGKWLYRFTSDAIRRNILGAIERQAVTRYRRARTLAFDLHLLVIYGFRTIIMLDLLIFGAVITAANPSLGFNANSPTAFWHALMSNSLPASDFALRSLIVAMYGATIFQVALSSLLTLRTASRIRVRHRKHLATRWKHHQGWQQS